MIEWLGSIGLGAVWGWLAGMAIQRTRRSWPLASILAGATLILLGEAAWILDGPAAYAFPGAALLACGVYMGWMRKLRRRGFP